MRFRKEAFGTGRLAQGGTPVRKKASSQRNRNLTTLQENSGNSSPKKNLRVWFEIAAGKSSDAIDTSSSCHSFTSYNY